MLAIIAKTIARFKESWGLELDDEAIQSAMRQAGHVWRDRELNPVTTVRMILLQILFGNVACDCVPRLAGKSVSGSAYCQARGRLPLEALQTLLTRSTSARRGKGDIPRLFGTTIVLRASMLGAAKWQQTGGRRGRLDCGVV
ncbi:MAG: hypothetical protein ACR2FY_12215 [Pirellulaceae bacterium]